MSSPVSIDVKEGNGASLGGGPGGHRRLGALWGSLERCEGGAEGPVALKVEYAKRQHYVKIVGVAQWEEWADAGTVVRLNATIVGGVEYTPAEVVTATSPGVYRPLFYAVYKMAVRDVLGMPNPLATVKLRNATAQAGLDGSAVVTAYTKELCQPTVETPPFSTCTAAVAATATAIALKKRRK
jgi:hypothetical protein